MRTQRRRNRLRFITSDVSLLSIRAEEFSVLRVSVETMLRVYEELNEKIRKEGAPLPGLSTGVTGAGVGERLTEEEDEGGEGEEKLGSSNSTLRQHLLLQNCNLHAAQA
jgi:hypothetical protein